MQVPVGGRIPAGLRPWIQTPGSLTRRMRRQCGGRFRVRVLREQWQRPWHDEQHRLGLRAGRYAWVREVLLCHDAEPWVYARSVIPARTLRGPLRRLQRLGRTPLGHVLFGGYRLQRGAIEVACLDPRDGLHARACLQSGRGGDWARRSVFRAGGKSLLVTEVFLEPRHNGETAPWR